MFGLDSLLSRITNMAAVASEMDLSKGNNVVEFKMDVSTMLVLMGGLYTVLLGLATCIIYLWWFKKPSLGHKNTGSKGLHLQSPQVSGASLVGYTSSCDSLGKGRTMSVSTSRGLRSPNAGACLCLNCMCFMCCVCTWVDVYPVGSRSTEYAHSNPLPDISL
jgi:hypothetical protein